MSSIKTAVADLLIVGGGPAAMALASAAHDVGLLTRIVATGELRNVAGTRALFADEAGDAPLAARISTTVVHAGERLDLQRAYAVVDMAALAAALPRDVEVYQGRVTHADVSEGIARVFLDDGSVQRARAVVDASGVAPALVELERARPAWQTAYGQIVEGDVGVAEDQAVLMDWSLARTNDESCAARPSFLYALPLGAGRFLLEETSLCRRPALDIDELAVRLRDRMTRMGTSVTRVLGEERVWIPMGTGLPRRGQRWAAYGAALGLVHPTTGYSVGRSLLLAPLVARTIASALREGDDEHVGDRVLDAVWPTAARETRSVFLMALASAQRFSAADSARFFTRFFHLPQSSWRAFLDASMEPVELRATALRLFTEGDARTRVALAKGLFAPASLDVVRRFLGLSGGTT